MCMCVWFLLFRYNIAAKVVQNACWQRSSRGRVCPSEGLFFAQELCDMFVPVPP